MSPCYKGDHTCDQQGCSQAHDQNRCNKKTNRPGPKTALYLHSQYLLQLLRVPDLPAHTTPEWSTNSIAMQLRPSCSTECLPGIPAKNDAAAVTAAQACKHCQHHTKHLRTLTSTRTHTLSCVVAAWCSPSITLHTAGPQPHARLRAAQKGAAGGDQRKAARENTRW